MKILYCIDDEEHYDIHSKKGLPVQVSDEDFEYLNQFKWRIYGRRYVYRRVWDPTMKQMNYISLAYVVMERMLGHLWEMKLVIDHIDRNRFNNTRENLRLCTQAENVCNRSKNKQKTSSDYFGVSSILIYNNSKINGIKWQARMRYTNAAGISKDINKHFDYTIEGEIRAAIYRDKIAKKYFGEFAALNFDHELTEDEIHELVEKKIQNGYELQYPSKIQEYYEDAAFPNMNGHSFIIRVSEDDLEFVNSKKWFSYNYIFRYIYENDEIKFLQDLLLEKKLGRPIQKNFMVGYRNGNNYDLRKKNLIEVPIKANLFNVNSKKANNTIYTGIYKHKRRKKNNVTEKWYVNVKIYNKEGKLKTISVSFPFTIRGEIEAACKYDEIVRNYYGKYAVVNFDHKLTKEEIDKIEQKHIQQRRNDLQKFVNIINRIRKDNE